MHVDRPEGAGSQEQQRDTRKRTWRGQPQQCRFCQTGIEYGTMAHYCLACMKLSCLKCRTAELKRGGSLWCSGTGARSPPGSALLPIAEEGSGDQDQDCQRSESGGTLLSLPHQAVTAGAETAVAVPRSRGRAQQRGKQPARRAGSGRGPDDCEHEANRA